MRKLMIVTILTIALIGCQKQNRVNVEVDPLMRSNTPEAIAVFPFLSALHDAEDPDGIAPMMMEQVFAPELDARTDYKFLSPSTVRYAIDLEKMGERYEKFLQDYSKSGETDAEFLKSLADVLKCDAFLIPVVYLWQKDEVDAQETSTPATYVGATITILARADGKILFRATGEDYMEGARTDTGDRSLVTGASGAIQSDLGARVHRAPPFEEVAVKVVKSLVASIPVR